MHERIADDVDPASASMDDDYDLYKPADREKPETKPLDDNPDIDAQLRGQQIQNQRGRDKLSDYGRELLG